ncbi:HNH endonuclease family protein [Streptomyces sp. DSM 44915]|uniref:HNH endonuclease family protein n=1 Tax=Streptomyces chisholmiae TaxID=3075540 RepID=A0ABU2JXG2_9ACTN|nr:HNH endonuclease family protein [Streptomyces sp. DSM 44915]MDT0269654.1 HNH endonuclease family protein [Streptomyces sp. DSM 44915]
MIAAVAAALTLGLAAPAAWATIPPPTAPETTAPETTTQTTFAGPATDPGPVPTADPVTLPLREAIDRLEVAEEDRTGYDRDREFGSGWTDADRDGCHTRAEVLLEEAVTPPTVTGRCTLSGGTWYSWYDDQTVTATDIDHLVPLAEAWDSGARDWTREQRVAYANYLDDPRHLEAVSQRSNRQKGDKDVAEWLPIESAQCRYLTYWVPVKLAWGLSVDPVELTALTTLAADCPNDPISYTPVPLDPAPAPVPTPAPSQPPHPDPGAALRNALLPGFPG